MQKLIRVVNDKFDELNLYLTDGWKIINMQTCPLVSWTANSDTHSYNGDLGCRNMFTILYVLLEKK